MYCKKLSNILQNKDSQLYGINLKDIQKLDYFIKNKTTYRERDNINANRFSIEMDVDLNKSLRLFMLGIEEELFSLVMYVECDNPSCDETYKINDLHDYIECDCGKIINISKENVDIYFNLTEEPTDCNLDSEEDISLFGLISGKSIPSKMESNKNEEVKVKLSTFEKAVGKEKTKIAINKGNFIDDRLSSRLQLGS